MNKTPSSPRSNIIIAIMLSALKYWLFAQSFINIGPLVGQTYQTSPAVLNLSISLTSFATGIFMVATGDIADKIGQLRMTYMGLIISMFASLLLIISDITALLIIGRILQGLSAAILLPSTVGVLNNQFKGDHLRRAISYLMISTVGGIGLAGVIGGLIATNFGWQTNFIISIVIAFIAILLLKGTPEKVSQHSHRHPFDYKGMSIFAVMIGSFTLLLTQGFEQGWFSTFSFICLSIFIITTLIFIIIERRHEVPFIDFSVLSNRPFIGAFLNNFVLNSGLGVTVVFFIYAQTHLGLSAAQSGLVTLPYAIVAVAMIRLGEKATLRFGGKLMLIIGPLFPVIGITIISMTSLQPSQYIIAVVIGFVICAIGNGLVATPGLTIAIFSMPNEKVGLATGLYKMSGTLGGAFGIALSTTVFSMLQLNYAPSKAATITFIVSIVLMILGSLSAYMIIPKTVKS
ncbi:multidrug resistance protein B [Staphylococcus aureus]|uniref:MFS transporter n=1 Tax=Staphylococcus aureus TaxID=1280 RepID=UPI00085C3F35|nr:MFS transporter [Staphylococcus aureus]SCT13636.1 multidrug resistance protein B [Staphylococcus aureus]SCT38141.1 multidrug resistance protein B [Staphylococcus aureus]SCT40918.1 multidrug resistance protein B [Staphylococcus aureus]SCT51056.1 multidrug resistance protein B [Staphylococcus aureus]SCT51340.1 multidrug resistance protein B [Staphylococcus aureus]